MGEQKLERLALEQQVPELAVVVHGPGNRAEPPDL
jgi:hypothetical protein